MSNGGSAGSLRGVGWGGEASIPRLMFVLALSASCAGPALLTSSTTMAAPAHVVPSAKPANPAEQATSTELEPDLNNLVKTVTVCGVPRNIWHARSQQNASSLVVEPAWIVTVNDSLSAARQMFCVDAMASSPSYLARAENALPLPLFMAEFALVAAGSSTDEHIAPIVVRRDNLAGTSKLCFTVNNSRDLDTIASTSQLSIRYAVKSKSAAYSNCTLSARERSTGAVSRALAGVAGANAASAEVWVTRRQLEGLLVGTEVQVNETCYASTGGTTNSKLDQQRVRELLPIVLPMFEHASLPIADAMNRLGAFNGQDAGARLASYLKKKSDELKTHNETTFDGSLEAEAKLLDLASGSGKTTIHLSTINDDLKKTDSEVSWNGQLVVPPSLDVYLVGRANGQRDLQITSTNVSVLGDKLIVLSAVVDIYHPKIDKRTEYLVPASGIEAGNQHWSKTLTLTDPNDSFDGALPVTYACSGPSCAWSYTWNRSRPICVTAGPKDHECEYGADFELSSDKRSVTVHRQTNPGQSPPQEYRIAIKRMPETVCPNKDKFLP